MAAVDGFEPSFFVSKTNELTIIRNRFFHNKPRINQKSNSRFPAMRQICVLRRSRMNPNNSSERIAKRDAGRGRRERGRFLQSLYNRETIDEETNMFQMLQIHFLWLFGVEIMFVYQ